MVATGQNPDGTPATGPNQVAAQGLASARPSASTVPSGYLYYATDTGVLSISDGVSTWTVISTTPASVPWTSYSPVWTSSGTAPSIGNGILSGFYYQIGHQIAVRIYLQFGSTTTGGTGGWSLSLPVQAASTNPQTVTLYAVASGSVWGGIGVINPSGTVVSPYLSTSSTDPRLTQAAATAPVSWANTNGLVLEGVYESS